MIFRQLVDSRSGALGYLLGDPIGQEAVVIDAAHGLADEYRRLLHHHGLALRYLAETHLHEDHLSAAPGLREATGARLVAGEGGGWACSDLALRHGDLLHFGEETLEVLHVPGHTPCSVAFRWRDRVFTGDSLLPGALGCPEGPGGDAEALCASARNVLLGLSGEILVFPGRLRNGRRVTTIAEERETNPDLAAGAQCAQAVRRRCGQATAAQESDVMINNRQCAADRSGLDRLRPPEA
jgi:glyoxylase-like metal-dependent hydrolase (beta-lactamase superfamily II)